MNRHQRQATQSLGLPPEAEHWISSALARLQDAARKVGLDFDDLVQEVLQRLWQIQDKIDSGGNPKAYVKSVAFTVARDAIAKNGVTPKRLKDYQRILAASEEIGREKGGVATMAEITERTGLTEQRINDTLEICHLSDPESIDGPDSRTPAAPESDTERILMVHEALDRCSPQTRELLKASYAIGREERHTYTQIAASSGMSESQVNSALKKARAEFESIFTTLWNE